MRAQSLTSRPEPCPGGCDHTDEEHLAFDAGLTAGEAGKTAKECPYRDDSLAEDWLTGHTMGADNRRYMRRRR